MTSGSLGQYEQKMLNKRVFWALMKCPKVAILPKSNIYFYDFKLSWAIRTENFEHEGFFWALLKCPKIAILPKSYHIVL